MEEMVFVMTGAISPHFCFFSGDHRFMMNNYSDWNQPDSLKRFSMFLTPKGMTHRVES